MKLPFITTISAATATAILPLIQAPLQDDNNKIINTTEVSGRLPEFGYICPPAQGSKNHKQYNADDIKRAAAQAVVSKGEENSEYPHRFGNYDDFDFFDCPKDNMQEYPLLHLVTWKPNSDPKKRGDPYYRMDPGGDRILVSFDGMDEGNVKYCGVVHHVRHNRFGYCTEKKRVLTFWKAESHMERLRETLIKQ